MERLSNPFSIEMKNGIKYMVCPVKNGRANRLATQTKEKHPAESVAKQGRGFPVLYDNL